MAPPLVVSVQCTHALSSFLPRSPSRSEPRRSRGPPPHLGPRRLRPHLRGREPDHPHGSRLSGQGDAPGLRPGLSAPRPGDHRLLGDRPRQDVALGTLRHRLRRMRLGLRRGGLRREVQLPDGEPRLLRGRDGALGRRRGALARGDDHPPRLSRGALRGRRVAGGRGARHRRRVERHERLGCESLGATHRVLRGVRARGDGVVRRLREEGDDSGADHRGVLRRQRRHRHRIPARRRHPAIQRQRVPHRALHRPVHLRSGHRQPRHAQRRRDHGRHGDVRRPQHRSPQRRTLRRRRVPGLLPDHEHALGRQRPGDGRVRRGRLPRDPGGLQRRDLHLPRPRGGGRGAAVPLLPHALLRGVPGGQRLREHRPQPGLAVPRRRRPSRTLPDHHRHAARLPV